MWFCLEKYVRAKLKFKDFSATKKVFIPPKSSFSSNQQILPSSQEKAVNSSSKASSVWPGEINKNVNKEKQKKSWLMKKLEPVTRSRIEFKNICLVMASAEN